MERHVKFKDLTIPMSRSLPFEVLEDEASELHSVRDWVDGTAVDAADSEKDLKRKIVPTRSKTISPASKKRKSENNCSAGSSKRRVIGDCSAKSSRPAAKKKKPGVDGSPVSSARVPLNFRKPEPVTIQQSFDDDYDDSEPLINKITKNVAKFSQLGANRTITENDSQLFRKNTEPCFGMPFTIPSWSDNLHIFSKPAKRAVKRRQIVKGFTFSQHSIQSYLDGITKSPQTPKGRKFKINDNNNNDEDDGSQLAIRRAADEGEAAIECSDVLVPIKTSKNAANKEKLVAVTPTSQRHHSGNVQKTAQGARKALASLRKNVVLNRTGDEQHSLEQNAARTLSSRFNSHSGVFGVSGSSTEQQQLPEPVVSEPPFNLPLCDQISGLLASEDNKVSSPQSAGRVLRPRKQKQNRDRPKRSYEEVVLSETDAFRILNRRIKVFWPLDDKWYSGLVKSYDPTNKLHYVRYDDHDEEWLSLQNEKFKLQLLPGETATAFDAALGTYGIRREHLYGDGRHVKQVEPRIADTIQLVSQTPCPTNLNCEVDPFTVENKPLQKSISVSLDASFSSNKDGNNSIDNLSKYPTEVKLPGGKVDNRLNNLSDTLGALKDIDFNTGNATPNSSSIPDRKKSGNVYVRRRYRKRCHSASTTDEGIRRMSMERVNQLQKVDDPLKCLVSEKELGSDIVHESATMQDFCAGVNWDQLCDNDSHPVKSQRSKGKVEPEIISASITDTNFSNGEKLEDFRLGNDSETVKSVRSEKVMGLDIISSSFPSKETSNAESMKHSLFGKDNEIVKLASPQNRMGQDICSASITGNDFSNAQNLDYLRLASKFKLGKSLRSENKPGSDFIPASFTHGDFADGVNMENSCFGNSSEPTNSVRFKSKSGKEIISSSILAEENLEHSQFGDDNDPVNLQMLKNTMGQASSGKESSNGRNLDHSWIVNDGAIRFELEPKCGLEYGEKLINCHGLRHASSTHSGVTAAKEFISSIHFKQISYRLLTEPSFRQWMIGLGKYIGSAGIRDDIDSGFRLNASGEDQPMNGTELACFLMGLVISQFSIVPFDCCKELDGEDLNLPFSAFSPLFSPGTVLLASRLYDNLILQQCGMVTAVWCNVKLDIFILDHFLGSSLFSFVGSLHEAVNGFIIVLATFLSPFENQYSAVSSRSMRPVDIQVPVSSIRVHLSSLEGVGTALDFIFYNFQEMTHAKWRELKKLLKGLNFFYKELPLANHTTANIGLLQSSSDHMSGVSFIQDPTMVVDDIITPPVSDGAAGSLHNVIRRDIFKLSPSVRRRNVSGILIERCQNVPPFLLSFAAAPSFFIAIHFKLLLGKPISPTGFYSQESELSELEHGLNFSLSETDDYDKSATSAFVPAVEISSKEASHTIEESIHCHLQIPESSLDVFVKSEDPTVGSNVSAWLTAECSKVEVDAFPVSTTDGWVVSSPRSSYCELNLTGTAAGLTTKQDSHDSFVHGNVLKLRRCPTNRGSWRFAGNSRPDSVEGVRSPVTELDVDCVSPFIGDGEGNAISTSRFLGQSVSNYIESSQPWGTEADSKPDHSAGSAEMLTSQGNFWDHDKFDTGSPSLSYRSQLWQDHGVQQLFYNSCGKPRKRRSGYYSTFYGEGTDDVPFKSRGHVRRGRPSRQNKEEKSKKTIDSSSNLRLYLDSVSCEANVLVVGADRGWRECGVQVVLESSNHNDWMLSVKLNGLTKYTYKAQQLVQSGTTNRYTHAMIWKGGKDWSLEFPDRKQWALFKELHEECYNRNLRAASVRHIPIPGVCKIEDDDCSSDATHFVRPSTRYIRQVGGEVDMALDTSRVMYDMDSEDEEWLGHFNNSTGGDDGYRLNQVSEETFERIMDLLEKAAFSQQRELLTSDEVADFCLDIGPLEVVKAIHVHWQEKRWRKGMPLVRYFQPASWERYQQQVKEWELQTNESQSLSTSNRHQLIPEKPPMFAFCLKPRGLEVPNKTQKQRSHRKFSGGQHIVLREQESSIFPAIRRHNGVNVGDDASPGALGMMQYSSMQNEIRSQPRSLSAIHSEAASRLDFMDLSHKTWKQKQTMKSSRRKAKKMRIFVASKDPQGGISHCNLDRRKEYVSHSWEASCGGQWNTSSHIGSKNNLLRTNSAHASAGSDFDAETRVREATNATRAASELAALKRAKAQRLLQKADLAVHKAVVAVVTAEAIQAAERDTQEAGQLDVEKIQCEHMHIEMSSATKESVLPCLAHWWPANVDPFGLRDDAVIGQNQCQSSVSFCTPSALGLKMQGDIMPVGATAFRKDLDSKQTLATGIEESQSPNEVLLPVASWSQEFDAGGCRTTLF